jgi:protoporphyrinogen oxidase
MYAARDGGQKREQFGYVQGGYATILAGLSSKLRELNVQVENRFAATRVRRNEFGEMAVSSLDGREHTYDRVVVTATPGIAARICTQLPESARDQLAKIETIGIVCPSVLLRRPLAGYYVTNITTPAPFTGIIEMSALVSSEELNNHGLVYLPKYAAANDPIWRESDESISERFLTSMCELYPDFERSDVLTVRISRAQHVFTLPTLGYSQTIPPTATSIPGLYLVNSAQIVNGTLNVNETIRLAESSVDEVCAPLVTEYQLDESQNAKTDGELVARPG